MKKVLKFIRDTIKGIDFKSKRTWVLFGLLVMIGFLSSLYGSYGYYINSGTKNVVISGTASFGSADITLQIYIQDRNASGAAIANSYSRVYYIPQINYSYESAKTVCGTGITLSYDSTEHEFTINSTQKGICKVYFAAEGTVVPNATFGLNVEQTLNGENYKQMGSLPDNDYVYSINSTRTSCTDPNATLTIEDRRIKVISTRDLDCNIYVDIESYTGGALVVFTSEDFTYTGAVQSFTVPATGYYKLEVWGAQGGGSTAHSKTGGNGGYSTGIANLTKDQVLYVYVGGAGNTGSYAVDGGWNGGGGVTNSYNSGGNGNHLGTGGGATDICTVSSSVTKDEYYRYVRTAASYNSRIIVAGGGGGAESQNGAAGGGTSGAGNQPGTQSGAGAANNYNASSWVTMYNGGLGYGVSTTGGHTNHAMGACGGGGYYGGGAYGYNGSEAYGSGGSGYVASSLTSASTVAGNTSFTSPTGTSETGHTGNGYARITWVGKTLS